MEILLRYLLFAEQNFRWECGFKSTKPCGNASDLGYTGIQFRPVPKSSHVKQNLLPFPFPPTPHPVYWQYFWCAVTHRSSTGCPQSQGRRRFTSRRSLFPLKLYHIRVFICNVVNMYVCTCVSTCGRVHTKRTSISSKYWRSMTQSFPLSEKHYLHSMIVHHLHNLYLIVIVPIFKWKVHLQYI